MEAILTMSDYETLEVTFTDTKSCRRRYRFESRDAGGWLRIEQVYRKGEWQTVGREIVSQVCVRCQES